MASVAVVFAGQEQSKHELSKPVMSVGRDEDCEVRIDNLGISRKHCSLHTLSDAFLLKDLGSANGTFVNGKRVIEWYLNDGDEIVIGLKYSLRFYNEKQPRIAGAAGPDLVPQTDNTYQFDATEIRKKLDKMRQDQLAHETAPGRPPPAPTARDYAKAIEATAPTPAAGEELARLKQKLSFVYALVAIMSVAVLALLLMLLRP